jgi:hypothetical protein
VTLPTTVTNPAPMTNMPTIMSALPFLNKEQSIAFIYLATAFLKRVFNAAQVENNNTVQEIIDALGPISFNLRSIPLRMYLGGQGGCGKSHLLHLFKKFTILWGMPNAVLITATTGTAAVNIEGVTIHSIINLMPSQGNGAVSTRPASENEVKNIQGVFMIIVDECSMLGLSQLYDINARLNIVKTAIDPTLPQMLKNERREMYFGDLDFILVGDFMQLAPVGAASLYSQPKAKEKSRSEISIRGKNEAIARVIFNNIIDVVVVLKVAVRQQKDLHFANILSRIRSNEITDDDVRLLNSRVVSPALSVPNDTPIIVYRNDLRNSINEQITSNVAHARKTKVFRIHAKFTADGKAPLDAAKIRTLRQTRELTTSRLRGTLDVYVGMPVMITCNVAVTGFGIANGTVATVFDVIYAEEDKDLLTEMTTDNDETYVICHDEKQPMVILLQLKNHKFKKLDGLPEGVFPLLVKGPLPCKLESRCSPGQYIRARMAQFPLVPAYSMTGHKVQGQTMNNILIADLDNNFISMNWLYTVLSRSTTLDGVFLSSKITDLKAKVAKQRQSDLMKFMLETLPQKDNESSAALLTLIPSLANL